MRSPRKWISAALLAAVGLLTTPTLGGAAEPSERPLVTAREAPRPGDRCAICGTPLGPEDTVLVVKGRRVPLMAEMTDTFLANPERYFARLQPRGALFAEAWKESRLRSGWFLAGLYVLAGLVFAGLTAYLAVNRGRAPSAWFFAGLVFNVAAPIALLALPRGNPSRGVRAGLRKEARTHSPAHCPACGFEVHPSAHRCPGCGAALHATFESEAERAAR